MKSDFAKIQREIDAMQPELARIRRDLHRCPETGWLEMRTTAILAKALRAMGYETYTGRAVCKEGARLGLPDEAVLAAHAERALAQGAPEDELTQDVRAGYTGVIAVLRRGEGPTLAMRFDIDALPMAECPQETHRPTREGFASVNPGMMHACGHDGHAAIGLGVARILAAHRDALRGTVKLIFQPAEEGVRGAHAIVENGWLDDVDVLLASHIAPTGQADDGDVTVGTWGSLATTKYDAGFTGRAAHAGGFPEQGEFFFHVKQARRLEHDHTDLFGDFFRDSFFGQLSHAEYQRGKSSASSAYLNKFQEYIVQFICKNFLVSLL